LSASASLPSRLLDGFVSPAPIIHSVLILFHTHTCRHISTRHQSTQPLAINVTHVLVDGLGNLFFPFTRFAEYKVFLGLLFLSYLELTPRPPALLHSPFVEKAVVGSRCGAIVGKAHQVLDYVAHEVPLPLFGLGHDWASTFRGAPLPL